jgi:cyclase
MPICYGGGLRDINDVEMVFKLGIDKVCFNTALHDNVKVVKETIKRYGSQSVVASIDFKIMNNNHYVYIHNGKVKTKYQVLDFAKELEGIGVGEIVLTSIDKDGTYQGYEEVSFKICELLNIPVAVNGGANSLEEMISAIKKGASAAIGGSIFSYYGRKKAIIPNYPERQEVEYVISKLTGEK